VTQETIGQFLDRLAQRTPTPGGGAVAALQAAQAAALVAMVARYSAGRRGQDDHSGDEVVKRADVCRAGALELAERDEAAFGAVADARRMPNESAAERGARSTAMRQALIGAAEPPAEVILLAGELFDLAEGLAPMATPATVADLAAAVESIRAAAATSGRNVRTNLRGSDPAHVPARVRESTDRAKAIVRRTELLLPALGD
jgi:formiminotetrahydrofolate cyclodeaminase